MGIAQKLAAVQAELKAPKDKSTSRYRYRSIEDINEAVKPLAAAQGCAVVYEDELREVGGFLVCVSTCRLTDGAEEESSSAFSIVNASPKGMSVEQACGAASSYARRYAACGLFAIDDSRDDPDERAAAAEGRHSGDGLAEAKRRLASSCSSYAQRYGLDASEVMRGVAERDDYAANQGDPAWFVSVAGEFDAS